MQKLKYVSLDDVYIPIAKEKVETNDSKYFLKAILTESKVGLRVVVYAGEKGKEKSQIFLEPDIKRLSFDQNDTHPSDIFTKLEATFDDGSKSEIRKQN